MEQSNALAFADANYWIAIANRNDQHFSAAVKATERIGKALLLTTDFVLAEFFNFYSERGAYWRSVSHSIYDRLARNSAVLLIYVNEVQFRDGLALHRSRLDKGYSLTDCLSMTIMRGYDCRAVLTNDQHFEQEGFTILM